MRSGCCCVHLIYLGLSCSPQPPPSRPSHPPRHGESKSLLHWRSNAKRASARNTRLRSLARLNSLASRFFATLSALLSWTWSRARCQRRNVRSNRNERRSLASTETEAHLSKAFLVAEKIIRSLTRDRSCAALRSRSSAARSLVFTFISQYCTVSEVCVDVSTADTRCKRELATPSLTQVPTQKSKLPIASHGVICANKTHHDGRNRRLRRGGPGSQIRKSFNGIA